MLRFRKDMLIDMPIKYTTFIFDFDGVIADSGRDIANCVRHIQEKYGCRLMSNEEIYSHLGLGPAHLIKMCTGFPEGDFLDKVIAEYTEYYLAHCVIETVPCEGLPELLAYLRGPYSQKLTETGTGRPVVLAVVTNKPESISNEILDKFGMRDYFSIVVGPESVKNLKPDPEGILKVLDFTNSSPSQTLMIGDSKADVLAARAAGVDICARLGGLGNQEQLIASQPDFFIKRLDDLISILED